MAVQFDCTDGEFAAGVGLGDTVDIGTATANKHACMLDKNK